jgi:hypothetical protein
LTKERGSGRGGIDNPKSVCIATQTAEPIANLKGFGSLQFHFQFIPPDVDFALPYWRYCPRLAFLSMNELEKE